MEYGINFGIKAKRCFDDFIIFILLKRIIINLRLQYN